MQDRHKSYVDVHRVDHSYEVGDRVFLRVKPRKSSIKLERVLKYLLISWNLSRLW